MNVNLGGRILGDLHVAFRVRLVGVKPAAVRRLALLGKNAAPQVLSVGVRNVVDSTSFLDVLFCLAVPRKQQRVSQTTTTTTTRTQQTMKLDSWMQSTEQMVMDRRCVAEKEK